MFLILNLGQPRAGRNQDQDVSRSHSDCKDSPCATGIAEHATTALELPVRFDAGLNVSKTNLLSRMIETWGKVPLEFIQHLDLRHRLYGFVDSVITTLYPLLRPGSFVENRSGIKNLWASVRRDLNLTARSILSIFETNTRARGAN